jgi:uncharacterized membrane protein YfcA
MDWMQDLSLVGIGMIAGFLNTMAGGGSLLVLPALIYYGMDGAVANGTNRVAIVAQSIASVAGFFKRGYSDTQTSMTLSLCALPGATLGAYLGTKVGGELFNRILGGLMILLIFLMSRKTGRSAATAQPEHPVIGHLLMIGIGFYGGFIQAGVGFFLMAALHRAMGLDLVRVNMHKVFIVGVYTFAALAIFASKGQVVWLTGVVLAAGNAIGGWIGAHYAVKKGERMILIVLNVVLAVMAIDLLIR